MSLYLADSWLRRLTVDAAIGDTPQRHVDGR
jgi:hypothetical protein